MVAYRHNSATTEARRRHSIDGAKRWPSRPNCVLDLNDGGATPPLRCDRGSSGRNAMGAESRLKRRLQSHLGQAELDRNVVAGCIGIGTDLMGLLDQGFRLAPDEA